MYGALKEQKCCIYISVHVVYNVIYVERDKACPHFKYPRASTNNFQRSCNTHTYTNLSAMIVILIMSENTVTNRTIIKTITNVTLSPIFFGQGVLSWGLLYV